MSREAWQKRRQQSGSIPPIAPLAGSNASLPSYVENNALITINAPDIAPSPVDSGMMEKINGYQARYVPFAEGDANAVVPISMWNGTVLALSAFQEKYGDVFPFLMNELGWSQSHLESALSPEQADAVALIIANAKEKDQSAREFMLCDEAGFGKGRILMTAAAWQIKNGIIPIIMTDSANLFSNLWQDVIDIGETETFQRFFIINESTPIEDMTSPNGGVLFPNVSPKLLKDTIATGTALPSGYGCVALTYSQINVRADKSKKVTFLQRLAENNKVAFVKDEGHNAVTYSANTSANITLLKKKAYASLDASATSSRHVVNMATYGSIYPWLSGRQFDLAGVSDHRQLWLSEMSVVRAVGAGQTIRRELDSTGVAIELVEPTQEMAERHGVIHDQAAVILNQMLKISARVKSVCEKMNARNMDKKDSSDYTTVPFGMRRSIIANQLEACLNVPLAIKEAVSCLKRGEKPFITLDMTMEGAVAAIFSENVPEDESDEQISDVDTPFSIKDLMRITLDRCMEYKHKGEAQSFTDITLTHFEHTLSIEDPVQNPYAEVLSLIEALPEMPASPIDAIRDGIEDEGRRLYEAGVLQRPWRMGEASGRKRSFVNGAYDPITKTKNAAISDFNFGITDGLIATTAIAVGATAHNCAKFSDQRTRTQIEVVACRDPIKRTQMWGRTNRRGNLTTPLYRTLTTGTPNSLCNIAMQNAKCKHLRASVSGSMESNMLVDVLDILSTEGNRIARKFLIRNPHIAALCNVDGTSGEGDDFQHVKKLFHASPLMSTDLMNRMMHFFHEEIAQSKARGVSFDVSSLGDNWSWGKEAVLIAPFNGGLSARRIERPALFSGLSAAQLPAKAASDAMATRAIAELAHQEKRTAHLARYLPHYLKSVKMAFAAAKKSEYEGVRRNPVVLEDERCDRMAALLGGLCVGASYVLPDRYHEKRPAVVTNIRYPQDAFDFDSYEVSYVVPGDQEDYTVTLTDMEREGASLIPEAARETVMARFNQSAKGRGTYTEKRWILQGNPLDCVMLSDMMQVGQKMTFNLADGSDVVGILVSEHDMKKNVPNAPIPTPDRQTSKTLLAHGIPLSFYRGKTPIISVRKTGGSYAFQFSGSDSDIASAAGSLKKASDAVSGRHYIRFFASEANVDQALDILEQKFRLYAPAQARQAIYDLFNAPEQSAEQEPEKKQPPQMTLNL